MCINSSVMPAVKPERLQAQTTCTHSNAGKQEHQLTDDCLTTDTSEPVMMIQQSAVAAYLTSTLQTAFTTEQPPTHSFTPGLKPSFFANPSHCSPSFLLLKYSLHGFPGLFTVISEHICFLLLVFSVFTLFSCRLRAVD